MLAATDATPPDLTPLYHSEEGDLRVNADMEGGRMRFYFAVEHEGVWRAVEGLYREGNVQLKRTEREVLEAIRSAVAKALEKLVSEQQGCSAEVGEPKERVDEKGSIVGYYFKLYGPHLAAFLGHAAETVRAEPAEVRLEGRSIVISAGDVKAEVEFKLLKLHKAEHLTAKTWCKPSPFTSRSGSWGCLWRLRQGASEWAKKPCGPLWQRPLREARPNKLPAEVMPGVELLNVYSAGGMKLYIFRAEGLHYYFAVKTEKEWRVTGGKRTKCMYRSLANWPAQSPKP